MGARTVITILFSVVLLVFPMYNSGCGPADVINGYKRLNPVQHMGRKFR